MLYKNNASPSLKDELFNKPTAEYRGTPFWAWNSMLTKDELERQIDIFKQMGLGGFHMHVRTGLENEYLSDEYMELVKACVEKAKKEDMLAWAYDEDRWPSGGAGGIVTKDKKYRARVLFFSPEKTQGCEKLLSCYDVALDAEGYLKEYKRIDENTAADGDKWYAYLKLQEPSSWYNNQTYLDTLNPDAVKRFIEVTHERYKNSVGDEFDKTVPAIFTDEPQFSNKRNFDNSFDREELTIPWTDNIPLLYKDAYGCDILDTIPELFWDLPDCTPSVHRYRYHDFTAELFASSFADTIGAWCKENNIALTGHMMSESNLNGQCQYVGEAMRSYRGFQLPGIDMLCNSYEFITAKQCQSAVRQFGNEGMMSELYGVTGWDCDFRIYKQQGDWQAAMGVTVRVPHLSWYSMAGEAKRDYPASIHYQSPWYKEYAVIENHFARVNTAMTRGKPVVKVAVVHPIESCWLHWGPNDKSALSRDNLNERLNNITEWLIRGSIDFDYISEALLPILCEKGTNPLRVGEMEYDAVIVPGCETLRKTTIDRLAAFREKGGKLIFMGAAPLLCDAVISDEGKKLYEKSIRIDFSRAQILKQLEDNRVLTIRHAEGRLLDKLIYQLRRDTDCMWLFIANACEPYNRDIDEGNDTRIILNGIFAAEIYNSESGEKEQPELYYQNGKTIICRRVYGYDSLLIKLLPGEKTENTKAQKLIPVPSNSYKDAMQYSLSEENVLLLDIAEYKLSGEADFNEAEEILRLDNICREKLGIPERGGSVVQPWCIGEIPDIDVVTLKFRFLSDIEYSGAFLALEKAEKASIVFNGTPVDNSPVGKYTDISIDKLPLPLIQKGENVLEVSCPIGERSDIENMFILGDFGVEICGRSAKIKEKPEKIYFGDLTRQGFPFYGGNITYKMKLPSNAGALTLCASKYAGALISVDVDGKAAGRIIYPPYMLKIDGLADGLHDVDVNLFIHRHNTFGPVHLANEKESWQGPGAWRSTGRSWSYEYMLKRTGIISAVKYE